MTHRHEPIKRTCEECGVGFSTRSNKIPRFCSKRCWHKATDTRHSRKKGPPIERACKTCKTTFRVITRGDANRRYCSQKCAKKGYAKAISTWNAEHPGSMKRWNKNRVKSDPDVWVRKNRKDRVEIIELLGGKCCVCPVTNQWWLHVDYIPTTRDQTFRHPRGIAFIKRHLNQFRLLCANHHYELTLTGRIEGTEVAQ